MPACSMHQHTATMFHCHCLTGRVSPISTRRRSQWLSVATAASGAQPTTAWSVLAAAIRSGVARLLAPVVP
eukprot:1113250-Lingulodinium_polyedra.AAC.1